MIEPEKQPGGATTMNFSKALDWLYSTQSFGIKLGLENTRRLLDALQVGTEGKTVFHVAGTNGKGSTCAFLDSICRAAGFRAGLFTSPHLVSFRERVRIDGLPLSEAILAEELTTLRHLVADWDPHPTFFEIVTGLGLKCFQDARVEVIVLETGLGGRLDSTTAVRSDVSVIAPVGLDHQRWLGNTIAEIAAEKAGIIKPGQPVVSGHQPAEAERVIREHAGRLVSPLHWVNEPAPESWKLGLLGEHQRWNAALAVKAVAASPLTISEESILNGLARTQWPARFQVLDYRGSTLVIDGAHNPAGSVTLVKTWREKFGDTPAAVVFGSVRDKDPGESLRILRDITGDLILTTTPTDRGIPAEELSCYATGVPFCAEPNPADAIDAAARTGRPILVTGSLFLAGKALEVLGWTPDSFEPSLQ